MQVSEPTADDRKNYAKAGYAMPDGSYYIRPGHPDDLTNAIQAVGRASGDAGQSDEEKRNAVRRHIIERATALKMTDKIPPTWNSDGTLKHSDPVEEFLTHYGVKGMHWGVRRNRSSSKAPGSPDAERARALQTQAKEQGAHTLSNEDLKHLTQRLQLEQQYSRLLVEEKNAIEHGHSFVKGIIGAGKTGIDAYNTYQQVQKIIGPLVEQATAPK
jgi:hypothetical protein